MNPLTKCSVCEGALPAPTVQLTSGGQLIVGQPQTYTAFRRQTQTAGVFVFGVCDSCVTNLGTPAPAGF
jgi:hypothetical protein